MAENFWDTSPRKGLIQYKVDHAKFPWFFRAWVQECNRFKHHGLILAVDIEGWGFESSMSACSLYGSMF